MTSSEASQPKGGLVVLGAVLSVFLASSPGMAQLLTLPAGAVEKWSIQTGDNHLRTLLAAPTERSLIATGGNGFLRIDPRTGAASSHTAPVGGRNALWASSGEDLIIGGYQDRHAVRTDGSIKWSWIALGCCNLSHVPPVLDLATGRGYIIANGQFFAFQLDTGLHTVWLFGIGADGGYMSVGAPGTTYNAGSGVGRLSRVSASSGTAWHAMIDPARPLRAVAIDANGDLVVSSGREHFSHGNFDPLDPGRLARVTSGGMIAWNIAANATTPPVVGPGNRIYVGTHDPLTLAHRLAAYDGASGNLVWSTPLGGKVNDVLVGDLGFVYALTGNITNGELSTVDARSGIELSRITDVKGAWEGILEDGIVFTVGPGNLSAIRVLSQEYDDEAPWPVRLHDNQRTGDSSAPLDLADF